MLSEKILKAFPDTETAQAYLDACRESGSCGFCWPDWDECQMVEQIPPS